MKTKITIILIALHLFSIRGYGQWQNIGPEGGIVFDVVSSGNALFCNTNGGMYKSIDGGDTWTDANNGLNIGLPSNMVLHYDTVVITNTSGNYNSTDGLNWTKIATPWGVKYSLDPYVFGLSGNVFYRSANGGRTWLGKNLNTTVKSGSFTSQGTTIYIGAGLGVWQSNDFGQNFTNIGQCSSGANLLLSSTHGLLAVANDGVYKFDGSSSFNLLSSNLPTSFNMSLYGTPINFFEDNSILYINTGNTVFSSPDGIIWTKNNGDLPHCQILNIRNVNNKFIACTSLGIHISTDKGVTWVEKNKNIKAHIINALAYTSTGLYAGLNSAGYSTIEPAQYGGIYKLNTSNLWQKTTFPDTISINQMINNGTNLYVIGTRSTASSSETRMFASTDDGATWQALGDETLYAGSMVYTNGTLFASINDNFSTKEIITSVDNGATWVHLVDNLPTNSALTNLISKGSDLYAIVPFYPNSNGGVFKSSDYGLTWNATNGSLGNMIVDKIGIGGTTLYANQSNVFSGIYAYVSNSTDNGLTWNTTGSLDIPNQTITSIVDYNGAAIFSTGLKAGGSILNDTGNIVVTVNNGATWTNVTGNVSQLVPLSALVYNNNLYIGTYGSSIWSLPIEQAVSIKSNYNNALLIVSLYPNPAQNIVSISSAEKIKSITCFTSVGQIIDVKFENNAINVSSLEKGLYFLNITAENGKKSVQKFIKE